MPKFYTKNFSSFENVLSFEYFLSKIDSLKRSRDMKGLEHILVMILEHIVRRHIRVCILKILKMS